MVGITSAVTDANGTVTNILHDNFGCTTQTTVANSATIVYNYSGGNLASMARTAGSKTQYYYFTYDAFGNTTQIRVGNCILVIYKYAPYGNIVSATGAMAGINPLLYRGYYFDQDTGLYYCNARYYSPKRRRLWAIMFGMSIRYFLINNLP